MLFVSARVMLRHMRTARAVLVLSALWCGHANIAAGTNDALRVDAVFPGGNIIVERLEGDIAFVAPDQRDTQTNQWWFYWHLRLRAPAEKPITIVFTAKNPLGVRGPAMSRDGGATWRWLGAGAVKSFQRDGKPAWSFEARVPAGEDEVRYSFCPQYLESHLRAWLAQHQHHPALRVEELCRGRKGRGVELLRAGCLDPAKSKGVVLVTSRHHCCEAMANARTARALGGDIARALARFLGTDPKEVE